jgi:predicted enzyme related to lactoylglutathione lyase
MSDSLLAQAPLSAVLPAVDSQRAWAFYHDRLGLDTAWLPEMPGQFIASAGRSTTILIREGEATRAEHASVIFVVQDIKAVVADLKSRGVVFENYDTPEIKTVRGIARQGRSRTAWLVDTEGNTLSISQM